MGNQCNVQAAGLGGTWAAGSHPMCQSQDLLGVVDLSGNVAEWVDACSGAGPGDACAVRGGSYAAGDGACVWGWEEALRSASRDDLGFRCCAD